MIFYIAICEDLQALRATGLVVEGSPLRGLIDSRSGNYRYYNSADTQSMIVITSLDGLEGIAELSYVTVTTPEAVFGYIEQEADEDGNLLWGPYYWEQPPDYTVTTDNWIDTGAVDDNGLTIYENEPTTETITPPPYQTRDPLTQEVPADPVMRALYDSIYDQSPVYDPEDPTAPPVIPSKFFALPYGFDSSYLL